MKSPLNLKKAITLIACSLALCTVNSARAAIYLVEVTTSPLVSNPNAPFYLDFQMNYGGAGSGNSATVNNFDFGGGAATGSPTVYSGNPSGDLTAGISLTANSVNPFNEIAQSFTPGGKVSFYANVTENASGATPDSLHFAILDKDTFQIPTSQPGLGLDLFEIDIDGAASAGSWAGTGDYRGINVSFTVVPEAPTYLAGLIVLLLPAGLQIVRRMRQGKLPV